MILQSVYIRWPQAHQFVLCQIFNLTGDEARDKNFLDAALRTSFFLPRSGRKAAILVLLGAMLHIIILARPATLI